MNIIIIFTIIITLLHENLATLKFSDFENSFFSGTLI